MLRNFLNTLRHFKMASSLNIIGLSVSFAAFILIMIQVREEFTAATDEPKHENIYRLESKSSTDQKWSINLYSDILNGFIDATPQIKATALFLYGSESIVVDDNVYERIPILRLGNDISKVFDVKMLHGVFTSALEPNSALLSHSTAQKLFGDKPAIGQRFKLYKEYTVTGVYQDFAANSALTNGIIIAGRANSAVNSLYCLFADGVDTEKIVTDFNAGALKKLSYGPDVLKFVPLADTYFDNQDVENSFIKRGSRTTTVVLLSIALLIIVIAFINFVNFSTSLAPVRIRALNIKSVFGSSRSKLRIDLIVEALLFAVLSYCISLFLVAIVIDTSLIELFKVEDLAIGSNLTVVIGTALLAVAIGAIAGIYPAFYSTRFTPALVLNGAFGLSTRGRALRIVLLGIQFIVSLALITCAMFVHLQNNYLTDKNLGYDNQNVIILSSFNDNAKLDLITQQVKAIASVHGVAKYNGSFGQYAGDMIDDMVVGGDTIRVNSYFVDCGFMELMGIPIIKGRGFVEQDRNIFDNDQSQGSPMYNVIINQRALRVLNTAVDSVIRHGSMAYKVVGVTSDVITNSMYDPIEPVMYIKNDKVSQVAIRVDATQRLAAMEQIRTVIKAQEPVELWKLDFFDDQLEYMYIKEHSLAILITLFSMLAIVISLMGVFGLVVFETQYRRREIGLRRINGATIGSILLMFNQRFVWIMGICFVVAVPLSWYGVNEWLNSFAYHTPIYWWIFGVAFFTVFFITLLTVTVQSWRAATENPTKSIKN